MCAVGIRSAVLWVALTARCVARTETQRRVLKMLGLTALVLCTFAVVIYLVWTGRRVSPSRWYPPSTAEPAPAALSVPAEPQPTASATPELTAPAPPVWHNREFTHSVGACSGLTTSAGSSPHLPLYCISFKSGTAGVVDMSSPIIAHFRIDEQPTKPATLHPLKVLIAHRNDRKRARVLSGGGVVCRIPPPNPKRLDFSSRRTAGYRTGLVISWPAHKRIQRCMYFVPHRNRESLNRKSNESPSTWIIASYRIRFVPINSGSK